MGHGHDRLLFVNLLTLILRLFIQMFQDQKVVLRLDKHEPSSEKTKSGVRFMVEIEFPLTTQSLSFFYIEFDEHIQSGITFIVSQH